MVEWSDRLERTNGKRRVLSTLKGMLGSINKLPPKLYLNIVYVCCIAEKRCFGLVKPQIVFEGDFSDAAILKFDVSRLQCQAPSSFDTERYIREEWSLQCKL